MHLHVPIKILLLVALAVSCDSDDSDSPRDGGVPDVSMTQDTGSNADASKMIDQSGDVPSDASNSEPCSQAKNPPNPDETVYIGNNERLYLSSSLEFVAHERCTAAVATINRAFPDNGDNTQPVTVFYEVTGDGSNEVSIESGSVTIPANKNYAEIPINPINAPETLAADREITISLLPADGYRISEDIEISKGSVSIAVKDLRPVKAFPSAYGAGAYSKGGRGGEVYHVTKLNDDGSEGTFRWALEQPRPATIVFDVSGTIILNNTLAPSMNDLTIAGQTAPAGGITITTDGGLSSNNAHHRIRSVGNSDNLIMRYVRIRHQLTENTGFEIYSNRDTARNVIWDHCSISWGGNSTFIVRGNLTQNITMQRSILAESKVGSLFGDSQQHEYSSNLSTHNNLWYNISHRVPNNGANGRVDNINNVIQNWRFRMSFINGDNRYNHLNNYYATGGRTSLFSGEQKNINQLNSGPNPDPYEATPYDYEIYTNGNIVDKGLHGIGDDNKLLWGEFDLGQQMDYAPDYVFVNEQHPLLGAPLQVQTAEAFYNEVTTDPDVGANKSLNADGSVSVGWDFVDQQYLAVMAQGEGSFEPYTTAEEPEDRSYYQEQRYIDFAAQLSTTPIATRANDFYVSNPHIPEVWFQANVPQGSDHNDVAPSGYTWLEEYLNQVDKNP